jgi:hypothetical protein
MRRFTGNRSAFPRRAPRASMNGTAKPDKPKTNCRAHTAVWRNCSARFANYAQIFTVAKRQYSRCGRFAVPIDEFLPFILGDKKQTGSSTFVSVRPSRNFRASTLARSSRPALASARLAARAASQSSRTGSMAAARARGRSIP